MLSHVFFIELQAPIPMNEAHTRPSRLFVANDFSVSLIAVYFSNRMSCVL